MSWLVGWCGLSSDSCCPLSYLLSARIPTSLPWLTCLAALRLQLRPLDYHCLPPRLGPDCHSASQPLKVLWWPERVQRVGHCWGPCIFGHPFWGTTWGGLLRWGYWGPKRRRSFSCRECDWAWQPHCQTLIAAIAWPSALDCALTPALPTGLFNLTELYCSPEAHHF